MFEIDPAFEAGSQAIGELKLCHARLQADARYPWIVLLPRIPRARELEDLPADARVRLMDEILAAGAAIRAIGETLGRPVAKLNVGQLGNVTPQLHLHVVGRRRDDPCWPGPVWGAGTATAYTEAELRTALAAAREALGL